MIYGEPIMMGESLNIAYSLTPPADTSKLWVPLGTVPVKAEVSEDEFQRDTDRLITKSVKLPNPLAYAAAVANGRQDCYIIGGYNGKYLDSILHYVNSPEYDYEGVSNVATLPTAMCGAAAVEHYGDVYIFGGYNGTPLDTILKFNLSTREVEVLDVKLPVPLCFASAVGSIDYSGYIYIIGGTSGSGASTPYYMFNPLTKTIKQASNLSEGVYGAPAVMNNGKVYVFGGNGYKNTIQAFTPLTGTLCKILDEELPTGVQFAAATTAVTTNVGGNAYIIGGKAASALTESVILEFNTDTETISETKSVLPSMPYGIAAATDFRRAASPTYLFGGYDGGYLDTIWHYQPRCRLKHSRLKIYATAVEDNAGYDPNAVKLFKAGTAQEKMHISSVYLGDDNDISREQPAYIYNTEAGEWQTLDGVAYSAT